MKQFYVNLYDGQGGQLNGFDCKDPVDGLFKLSKQNPTFKSAACFYLSIDNDNPSLPRRQWFFEFE